MSASRGPRRQSDGEIPRPGDPRIQDVAQRAGVAIGTVSNVLNNPDLVTEQTRIKVETAIAELGFCPRQRRSGPRGTTIHLIPRRSTLR